MTVLEAINQSLVPPDVFADKLSIGKKSIERLLSNMDYDPSTGCWIWMRAKIKDYGCVKIRAISDSILQVHRVCYGLVHGPVPANLHIHHRVEEPICCSGPSCGNPAHTMPLTPADHVVKYTPGSASYVAASRDCCEAGHPYTPENTRIVKSGARQCRECDRLRAQHKRDNERGERPKFAKSKLKEKCKRDHSLMDESNIKWVDTPWGKQKQCRACIEARSQESRARFQKIIIGELPPVKPSHLQKDVCVNGHPMDPENTYIRPDGTGRACMKCRLDSVKRSQAANREEHLKGRRERRASIRSKVLEEFKARVVGIYASGVRGEDLAQQLKEALPPTNLRPTKGIIQQAAWQKILEIYKMDIPDDELIQRLRDALPPAEQ